ncbi:MAG: hypothetical protein C0438_05225 [Pseudomonas sp.]|nr:hypothetical protein [Pseudomonas sp.]
MGWRQLKTQWKSELRSRAPLITALSQRERGKGADLQAFQTELDSGFQVGVILRNGAVSPLSLWERVRVWHNSISQTH